MVQRARSVTVSRSTTGFARPPAGPRARRSVAARANSATLGERFTSARELVQSISRTIDESVVSENDGSPPVSGVADCLTTWVEQGGVLPEEFLRPSKEGYGRRALHVDKDGKFGIIIMTWSPGQSTSIHDHDDMWCVECVYSGRIRVLAYDVDKVAEADDLYLLTPAERGEAGVGEAGMLIPPKDIHELSNALEESLSCTIHVYGGHMEQCQVFTPVSDHDQDPKKTRGGLFRKESRSLYFTRCPDWTCDHI